MIWLIVQKRGAGKASYITENDVLLDVEREIIEVNGLGAHFDQNNLRRKMHNTPGYVDEAVCVTIEKPLLERYPDLFHLAEAEN